MLSVETIIRQIRLIEANPAAIELCGERVAQAHFTESFVDAFCAALNAIDEHGTLPPFEAELIRADTDVGNAPMAAAFARGGYRIAGRRIVMS